MRRDKQTYSSSPPSFQVFLDTLRHRAFNRITNAVDSVKFRLYPLPGFFIGIQFLLYLLRITANATPQAIVPIDGVVPNVPPVIFSAALTRLRPGTRRRRIAIQHALFARLARRELPLRFFKPSLCLFRFRINPHRVAKNSRRDVGTPDFDETLAK